MSLPQRQCLILQGGNDWLIAESMKLAQQVEPSLRCWVSDHADRPDDALGRKQVLQQLGQDNLLVVFDARETFSADAFGAVMGTLCAGGCLVLLFPAELPSSLWLRRFIAFAKSSQAVTLLSEEHAVDVKLAHAPPTITNQPTTEQLAAIEAVLHVVKGHRRRPLVIHSDRGRGKTALLGMAAAELLKLGKQRILVTAPAARNTQTLFTHAAANLPEAQQTGYSLVWQQGCIEFVAADALLAQQPSADLLIVDEAAAIPAALLEQMLRAYSRVVFATTLHGYEGTGRGFAVRFTKTLDKLTPNWRNITLNQPVRWAQNDALERFSFDALLLDAEPVSEAMLSDISTEKVEFEFIEREALADNESSLREIYGLMVLAHYRTRPSDLQMLLDHEGISVAVLRFKGHVVASAWLVDEAPMDNELAIKVFDGQRRLKGQLLPQSLLAHAGIAGAGEYAYQRVIRIAVHPAIQSRGFGQLLLDRVQQQIRGKCDLIGTSFAMETAVTRFWLNNGFQPVRLGQHLDDVTGGISVMMLKSISTAGEQLLTEARKQFNQQWPFLISTQLRTLAPEQLVSLAPALRSDTPHTQPSLSGQLDSFAHKLRSYESSQFALWQWGQEVISSEAFQHLADSQQQLLVMVILQQRELTEVSARLGLNGKAELIKVLRQAVSDCL